MLLCINLFSIWLPPPRSPSLFLSSFIIRRLCISSHFTPTSIGQWAGPPPPPPGSQHKEGQGPKPGGGWEESSPPSQRRNMPPNYDDGTSLWGASGGPRGHPMAPNQQPPPPPGVFGNAPPFLCPHEYTLILSLSLFLFYRKISFKSYHLKLLLTTKNFSILIWDIQLESKSWETKMSASDFIWFSFNTLVHLIYLTLWLRSITGQWNVAAAFGQRRFMLQSITHTATLTYSTHLCSTRGAFIRSKITWSKLGWKISYGSHWSLCSQQSPLENAAHWITCPAVEASKDIVEQHREARRKMT